MPRKPQEPSITVVLKPGWKAGLGEVIRALARQQAREDHREEQPATRIQRTEWISRLDTAGFDFDRARAIAVEIERFELRGSLRLAATHCQAMCRRALKNGATETHLAVARNAIASLRRALQEVAE